MHSAWQWMRGLAGFALGVLVLANTAAAVETASQTPLQVLQECLAAVRDGDFAGYVDHLSKEEQSVQAGCALVIGEVAVPGVEANPEEVEPEILLLLRAVDHLIQQHATVDGGKAAREAGGQLLGNALATAQASFGIYGVVPSQNPRDMCLGAAKSLKDPRAFLIALLKELSRPLEIDGRIQPATAEVPDPRELAKALESVRWTIYSRGDYAIAVPAPPASEKLKSEDDKPVDGPPSANSSAEQAAPAVPWTPRIEFRRRDGQWKICRLMPLAQMLSVGSGNSSSSAAVCPPPSLSQPVPSSPSQPAIYQPAAQPVGSAPATSIPSSTLPPSR